MARNLWCFIILIRLLKLSQINYCFIKTSIFPRFNTSAFRILSISLFPSERGLAALFEPRLNKYRMILYLYLIFDSDKADRQIINQNLEMKISNIILGYTNDVERFQPFRETQAHSASSRYSQDQLNKIFFGYFP